MEVKRIPASNTVGVLKRETIIPIKIANTAPPIILNSCPKKYDGTAMITDTKIPIKNL